ncbi:MAG: aldehyde dehydrogenase family protein [Nitrososphaerota archaeon]|jgi:acetaldehyde dehydrogenase/alcohol dehydrogenase|nr:aldehyde dehydrogenase family protein [Nitrososphaerota archaeon]
MSVLSREFEELVDVTSKRVMSQVLTFDEIRAIPEAVLRFVVDKNVNAFVNRSRRARELFLALSLKERYRVILELAVVAREYSGEFADAAVKETKMGNVPDKKFKKAVAAEYTFIENIHTLFREGDVIGSGGGTMVVLTPKTNPISTLINASENGFIAGNSFICLPHPNAQKSSIMAGEVLCESLRESAKKLNADSEEGVRFTKEDIEVFSDLLIVVKNPTLYTRAFIEHEGTDIIAAVGGAPLVKKLLPDIEKEKPGLLSKKKFFLAGPGNAPVVILKSANIVRALKASIKSKGFDHGVVCAAENTVFIEGDKNRYEEAKEILAAFGGHILSVDNALRLKEAMKVNGGLNPDIPGHSVEEIVKEAKLVGVPKNTSFLVVDRGISEVDRTNPLDGEKLSLIFTIRRGRNPQETLDTAKQVLEYDGNWHTASMYLGKPTDSSKKVNEELVKKYNDILEKFDELPAGRRILNTNPKEYYGTVEMGAGIEGTEKFSLMLPTDPTKSLNNIVATDFIIKPNNNNDGSKQILDKKQSGAVQGKILEAQGKAVYLRLDDHLLINKITRNEPLNKKEVKNIPELLSKINSVQQAAKTRDVNNKYNKDTNYINTQYTQDVAKEALEGITPFLEEFYEKLEKLKPSYQKIIKRMYQIK